MSRISRQVLIGALTLIFLTSACGAEQGTTPTFVGTLLPENHDLTNTPIAATETIGATATATP